MTNSGPGAQGPAEGAAQSLTGPHTATTPAWPEGVPGHEVLRELGRGGMGVVYEARQTQLNRVVALKMVLAGGHAGPEEQARFRAEAEAIARLQHPNIVQVFEVGQHKGALYFSLELCPGGSLDRKLAGTPLPGPEAAALVEVLARAMHAAHQKGVVHRDLKLANVLLAEDGTPKITDFGLAKRLDEVGQTATGATMGTPPYMAPEQAAGKSKDVGPRTDVYALGAILYECLTGRPPFRAATALDTLFQVLNDEPVPPRQLSPRVGRDLETICLHCLRKEPAQRYASAEALAEDLHNFLSGKAIKARPVGRIESAIKWVKRRPAPAAALVASLIALVALVGGGLWLQAERISRAQGQLQAQLQDEQLRRQEAELASQKSELARRATERDAQKKLARERRWQSLYDGARSERLGGHRWKALELLAEAAQVRRSPELEQEAFRAAIAPGARLIREVIDPGASYRVLSPDGRFLVVAGNQVGGEERRTGVCLWPFPKGKPVWHPLWSSTGLGAAKPEWGFSGWPGPHFVRDGARLLLAVPLESPRKEGAPNRARDRYRVDLWCPATGETVSSLPGDGRWLFCGDGRWLVCGDLVYDLPRPGAPTRLPALAHAALGKSEVLLGGLRDEKGKPIAGARLVRWDLRTGKEVGRLPEGKDVRVASSDGRYAVLSSPDVPGARDVVELWGLQAGARIGEPIPLRPLKPFERRWPCLLSEDARWFAVEGPAGEGITIRDGRTGTVRWVLEDRKSLRGPALASFAPGGDVLAVFHDSRTRALDLWDMEARRKIATLDIVPHDLPFFRELRPEDFNFFASGNEPLWALDGRWLLTSGWGHLRERGSSAGRHRLWEVARLSPAYFTGRRVLSLRFAPDGNRLAVDGDVWVVRRPGGRMELGRPSEAGVGQLAAFTADGLRGVRLPVRRGQGPVTVVTVTGKGKDEVPLPWPDEKPEGGERKGPVKVAVAGLSPSGRYLHLAYGRDDFESLRVFRWEMWDLQGRPPRRLWEGQGPKASVDMPRRGGPVCFSPDESRVAVTGPRGAVIIREVRTGKWAPRPETTLFSLFPGACHAMGFRADWKQVFLGDWRGNVWRGQTKDVKGPGQADYRAEGHKEAVLCLALGVGDRLLATGGRDRTIRLWEASSGRTIASWEAHEEEVTALAFSPDGRALVSAGADGMLKVWNLALIAADLEKAGLGWRLPAGVRWTEE